MANSVQLPFHVPIHASTQGMAAPGLALENHPTGYNQILNQCVTLCCTRKFLKGHTAQYVTIPNLNILRFSCLEKHSFKFQDTASNCKNIFEKMLSHDFYIYFYGVDDFYLPGKTWYNTRHFYHDGILCGYDNEDQTYTIAAYDQKWVFNSFRVPQHSFFEGLNAALSTSSRGFGVAYKVANQIIPLNKQMILVMLKDHLQKTYESYSLDNESDVTGLAVYDFLVMYLEKLKDGSIPHEKMDWRCLRPVWEHHRCMLDRLCAVENLEHWEPTFSMEYKPLVDLANRVRMMYAMYHKNNKGSILDSIQNGLFELRDKEQDILQRFVEKLEVACR